MFGKDKKSLLLLGVGIQTFFLIPFIGSAFWVAATANQGFNVVLTALLNIVFSIGGYFVLRNHRTQFAVGVLVGVSMMMTMISLMTAVFWGQLSNCEVVVEDIEQYSCSQRTAYGVVSALAAILFVIQILFSGAMIIWKRDVVEEIGMYDDLPRSYPSGRKNIDDSFHSNAVDL